jgi:hypothetical protein
MFQKTIFLVILVSLLAACAAPTAASPALELQASEVSETSEVFTPTVTPTETLAPTSTPEPTATPTPEPVVIQKEVTFDLTNGDQLSMPGTIPNILKGETPEEIIKIEIETIKAMFQSMLSEGLAFGDLEAPTSDDFVPPDKLAFWKKLAFLPEVVNAYPGFRYPDASVTMDPSKRIFLGAWGIPDPTKNGSGTLVKYKTITSPLNYRYLGIDVNRFRDLLSTYPDLLPPTQTPNN